MTTDQHVTRKVALEEIDYLSGGRATASIKRLIAFESCLRDALKAHNLELDMLGAGTAEDLRGQ